MPISGKTQVYAILGNPVEQSFSPLMHNLAFHTNYIDAVYIALKVDNLKAAIQGVKAMNIKGCSVTIPFKIDVIPYLDEVDTLALNIGAVNTIVNRDGKLVGHNTDGIGALRAITEMEPIKGKKIAILGSGGAARAIAFTLATQNPQSLTIWGADEAQAKALAAELSEKTSAKTSYLPITSRTDYHILINCSPVGMYPQTDVLPIPEDFILEKETVFDIIYNPKETLLLKKARLKQNWLIYGYKMLLYQGMEQFKLWTGQDAPADEMEEVLLQHI